MLDSVLYAYQKYHRKKFLEECKYAQEKIKTKDYIGEELRSESDNDNDTDTDFDNDNDNEEENQEKSKSDNDE